MELLTSVEAAHIVRTCITSGVGTAEALDASWKTLVMQSVERLELAEQMNAVRGLAVKMLPLWASSRSLCTLPRGTMIQVEGTGVVQIADLFDALATLAETTRAMLADLPSRSEEESAQAVVSLERISRFGTATGRSIRSRIGGPKTRPCLRYMASERCGISVRCQMLMEIALGPTFREPFISQMAIASASYDNAVSVLNVDATSQ